MESILLSSTLPLLPIITIFASIILILTIWRYRSYKKRKEEDIQLKLEDNVNPPKLKEVPINNSQEIVIKSKGIVIKGVKKKSVSGKNVEVSMNRFLSQNSKIIVDIEVDKDFDKFTYSDALKIITEIEIVLNKNNIKFRDVSKGSTILSIELDYEDAMKLLKLIQEEKYRELGIKNIKVQKFAWQKGMAKKKMHNEMLMSVSAENHGIIMGEGNLNNFISQMKNNLTNNIEKTLLLTKAKIKESSPKFNDIIMITGKFNRLKEDLIKGIIDKNDSGKVSQEISNSLLMLLDSLNFNDLEID